jgi:hypothetical protein
LSNAVRLVMHQMETLRTLLLNRVLIGRPHGDRAPVAAE